MGQSTKAVQELTEVVAKKKNKTPTEEIDSRRTDELVVALCGAIGTGVSTVADEVERVIKARGYEVQRIKLSSLIQSYGNIKAKGNEYERIKSLQEAGNELRGKYGSDILSQLAIKEIVAQRIKYFANKHGKEIGSINFGEDCRNKRRYVSIIDSLKNPKEVELLEKVYGKMFYFFGVLCNDKLRKERLLEKGMDDPQAADLMERDKREKISHGQQLLKTLQHADFFVRNNKPNITSIHKPITRFIDLILGQNNITPTIDEFGMYIAESASRMSGCISRQVGAAILTDNGDIVSTGRNDVPKPGGGLYGEDDDEGDCRCFKFFDHSCSNEKNKTRIFDNINDILRKKLKITGVNAQIEEILAEIKSDSEIKDLLEYSRAVHAEMDAIISAARIGHYSLKNTILFSTTFPCHHCARHIVAAGIRKVYYIEPYEKSLATKLHSDAIDLDSQNVAGDPQKVLFLHFEGVAPKQYLNLFACNNRKKDGRLKEIELISQIPTASSRLDTFIEYESKVVKYVDELIPQSEGEG